MIYYIGYYTPKEICKDHRQIVPAANAKMEYIKTVIVENCEEPLTIISPVTSATKKPSAGRVVKLDEKTKLVLFPSLGRGNKIKRGISYFLTRFSFFAFLRKNVHSDDTVIVYHSLIYMNYIIRLKKEIGFQLILEVEEIYSDVTGKDDTRKLEMDYFRCGDAYIFSTELLNSIINTTSKPYAVANGSYKTEKKHFSNLFENDCQVNQQRTIHCVYAGTLDPRKGGASAAVAAAEYLPSEYHIHILGFGSHEKILQITEQIADVSLKTDAVVSYDGCLSGDEYLRFIQSCDIGLSTQEPSASFNNTSFPSKILSYMSNGLRVVSIRLPVIETSGVGEYIAYYNEQCPQKIAKAILSVDLINSYDSQQIISDLDRRFVKSLQCLLDDLHRKIN